MKVQNLSRLIPSGNGLRLTLPVDLKHTAKYLADKLKVTQFGVSRINVDKLLPDRELFILWDISIDGMMMIFEYNSAIRNEATATMIAAMFTSGSELTLDLNENRKKDGQDYFDYTDKTILADLFDKCSMQRDVVQQAITNHFKD